MLDALKFAFEILVVATLALPWLALLHRMFPVGASFSFRAWLDLIPKDAKSAVSITVVLAFGYLLGSAIERISRNFFNDDIWRRVPTEYQIRVETYREAYCEGHLVSELSLPFGNNSSSSARPQTPDGPETLDRPKVRFGLCPSSASAVTTLQNAALPEKDPKGARKDITEVGFQRRVEDMFRLQEGTLLLQGADKVARLKEYYDQIAVLRGAAFNGFLLFALSAFGLLGSWRLRWATSKRWGSFLLLLPACLVVLFALESTWHHWSHIVEKVEAAHTTESATDDSPRAGTESSHSTVETLGRLYVDPPLAEFVVLLIGIAGIVVTLRAEQATPYLRICTVAAVLTLISFGGWWWTEVMYDREVIHSQPILALGGERYIPADPNKP
jgi:hypothetical protein